MRLTLLTFLTCSLSFATLTVSVTGVTNTQAVFAYIAPDSNPCTVEISESVTYSPLVHDVDSTLYSGANSDARGSGISNGTSRIVVVGARLSQLGLDSVIYSRALQANTLHYYRVTCSGGNVGTGTFTTASIPWGVTYQDLPQLDPANPGNGLVPTISNTVRGQRIIDPKTGAALYLATLPADTNYTPGNGGTYGPFMYFGGTTRVCSNGLMGPDSGYLCSFASGNGGYGALYYIIPSTPPEVRFLGYMPVAYPYINPADGKFYNGSGASVI